MFLVQLPINYSKEKERERERVYACKASHRRELFEIAKILLEHKAFKKKSQKSNKTTYSFCINNPSS